MGCAEISELEERTERVLRVAADFMSIAGIKGNLKRHYGAGIPNKDQYGYRPFCGYDVCNFYRDSISFSLGENNVLSIKYIITPESSNILRMLKSNRRALVKTLDFMIASKEAEFRNMEEHEWRWTEKRVLSIFSIGNQITEISRWYMITAQTPVEGYERMAQTFHSIQDVVNAYCYTGKERKVKQIRGQ